MNWDVTVAVVFFAAAVFAIVSGELVEGVAFAALSGVQLNVWRISELRRELDHLTQAYWIKRR